MTGCFADASDEVSKKRVGLQKEIEFFAKQDKQHNIPIYSPISQSSDKILLSVKQITLVFLRKLSTS